ncbi:MAG: hypothetical protein HUU32_05130 [Calditrichaceae bacterium]|nr:hypothetical protein [Calditrichia bacterium]NUQ40757.1 hypothetical protein [Calditrichaceae bacterium]
MPTKTDAVRFVADAKTSPEQLRRACEILGLPVKGEPETLRARLLEYLNPLSAAAPVVCLNPRLNPDSQNKPGAGEQ